MDEELLPKEVAIAITVIATDSWRCMSFCVFGRRLICYSRASARTIVT